MNEENVQRRKQGRKRATVSSLVAVPDTGVSKRTKRDAPGKIIGTLL